MSTSRPAASNGVPTRALRPLRVLIGLLTILALLAGGFGSRSAQAATGTVQVTFTIGACDPGVDIADLGEDPGSAGPLCGSDPTAGPTPQEGIQVVLHAVDIGHIFPGETDAEGKISFEDLPAATYTASFDQGRPAATRCYTGTPGNPNGPIANIAAVDVTLEDGATMDCAVALSGTEGPADTDGVGDETSVAPIDIPLLGDDDEESDPAGESDGDESDGNEDGSVESDESTSRGDDIEQAGPMSGTPSAAATDESEESDADTDGGDTESDTDDADDIGSDDSESDQASGEIALSAYVCTPGDDTALRDDLIAAADEDADDGETARMNLGLDVLQERCSDVEEGLPFTLTDDALDAEDENPYQELIIGGDDAGDDGWTGLGRSTYAVEADLPNGYGDPIVVCTLETDIDGNAVTMTNQVFAPDGILRLEIAAGNDALTCDWFNVDLGSPDEGSGDTSESDDTGSNGTDDGDGDASGDQEIIGDNGGDSDGDGLPDADEENLYGTDPQSFDSDADNLDDGEESLVYGTDPLNPDTDGDGADDGAEVNEGTDPLLADT